MRFLNRPVPMWRALLALAVGVTVSTVGMYNVARQAVEMVSLRK